jgi:hypothetical protein
MGLPRRGNPGGGEFRLPDFCGVAEPEITSVTTSFRSACASVDNFDTARLGPEGESPHVVVEKAGLGERHVIRAGFHSATGRRKVNPDDYWMRSNPRAATWLVKKRQFNKFALYGHFGIYESAMSEIMAIDSLESSVSRPSPAGRTSSASTAPKTPDPKAFLGRARRQGCEDETPTGTAPISAVLWQKVEAACCRKKLKTRRGKLAHYRRTKRPIVPFGSELDLYDKRRREDVWQERTGLKSLRAKCYVRFGSPVVHMEKTVPPDDYLLRLSVRHGKRFSRPPEIQGWGCHIRFDVEERYSARFGTYRAGIAFVDAWQITLRDGRIVLHFAGEFSGTWEDHPLRRKEIKREQPHTVDLLAALFCINRSTKRHRDAASASYAAGAYGFATSHKRAKEFFYALKDCGIAAAFNLGRINLTGQRGSFAEYRGEGYCFHSLLLPVGAQPAQLSTEELHVEAKPKTAKEVRLCDAIFTLKQTTSPGADFTYLQFPSRYETCAGEARGVRDSEAEYEEDDEDEVNDEDFV